MIQQRKKIINISIHVAVWICFFLLPFIFSPLPIDIPKNINKHLMVLYIMINIFLLGFYYLNTLLLIPKLLFKRKVFLYLGVVAVFFIAFLYVPRNATQLINGTTKEMIFKQYMEAQIQRESLSQDNHKEKARIINRDLKNKVLIYFPGSFVVFLLILTIGICSKAIGQWIQAERTKEQIIHEQLNTELSFLKSQVNPHFFFNTLNNIYSLAVMQSDKTAPAVLKLSSIMRYMLTEVQEDKTLLENELNHIKNYIELQQERLTDKVKLSFDIQGSTKGKYISPLLFIPFIENAFKYGVSTKDNSEIDIHFIIKENSISLNVLNTIVPHSCQKQQTTGTGINNVKRRLDLLYPNKHSLLVEETDKLFTVNLEINLV